MSQLISRLSHLPNLSDRFVFSSTVILWVVALLVS